MIGNQDSAWNLILKNQHMINNKYGRKTGFSVRKEHVNRSIINGDVTSRLYVCCKAGFRVKDKRDYLTKNPRAETRTGCHAHLHIKLNKNIGRYCVDKFEEEHNHCLVPQECTHMMPSQRKISMSQAIGVDLANESGIPLKSAYELMGKQVGGRTCLGYTKLDQKNYLRSKRQRNLAFGEAGSLLRYFQKQAFENPSFFYAVQLDSEEQITNVFWADAKMIIDYSQFGDVVFFDTTYKTNRANRPFATFVGLNHHREMIIFGAALMYDETIYSFVWLFETFLEAMSKKKPKTIFTDQDAAMAKALQSVMPGTYHRLCSWHIMQNAIKHLNVVFKGSGGVKSVLSQFMDYHEEKFMDYYEEEDEFLSAWDDMITKSEVGDNTWLCSMFELREKWAKPYVKRAWSAGMKTTQLSESFNASLKGYLESNHDLMQFFTHFERMLHDKRYKELESEYALCYKLPNVRMGMKMLIHAGNIYTNAIFDEFQKQYEESIDADIKGCTNDGERFVYTIVNDGEHRERQVKRNSNGLVFCSCRRFEMRGVLCSHAIKILREILHVKEIPSEYILKRWTRDARVGLVQDCHGRNSQGDVNLEVNSHYRNLFSIFIRIASRAAENVESYKVSLKHADELNNAFEKMLKLQVSGKDCDIGSSDISSISFGENKEGHSIDMSNAIAAKGFKKREASRGRRRIKSKLEIELQKRKKKMKKLTEGKETPDKLFSIESNSRASTTMCQRINGTEIPITTTWMSYEFMRSPSLNHGFAYNQNLQASNSPHCNLDIDLHENEKLRSSIPKDLQCWFQN